MKKRVITSLLSVCMGLGVILGSAPLAVRAESASVVTIDGRKYEFGEKSKYEISENTNPKPIDSSKRLDGRVVLNGDLVNLVDTNGFASYGVSNGAVSFSYEFGSFAKENADDKWHIVEDKSKEVDGQKLQSKIGKGAIIVHTSQDGVNWVFDSSYADVLDDDLLVDGFYKTKNIQLVGGCYYRVTVVYETEKKVGEKKTLVFTTNVYENKKYAEVFEFYLHDAKSSDLISDTTLKMALGSTTRTEKNDGYYGSRIIDVKDPHFSWELGHFFVSGYTENTENADGIPVFLKVVNDPVTLWFNLEQDIDCLNGNDRLSINEDTNGYDRDFGVQKTNFGRGTLIVRKTDYQNITSKPEIYTNYLEANASTGANTVVGLFEEGDYEVSLDYEIKNTPRQVKGIDVIPEYSDYTIRFKFSVRNGNCMVYPFDLKTGEELINTSITPNGFRLDMARSRYLSPTVQKFNVSKKSNIYVLDERFNRPAKDGDSYDEEGIYVFTVSNQYTGEKTTKTIYVGDSPIIKALATSAYSLDEINQILMNGGKIDKNGKVTKPN